MSATLTRADNLRRVLRGEEPAWVPFAPNFWQWFNHHQAHGILPPQFASCEHHVDIHLAEGHDIFTRNFPSGYGCRDTRVEPRVDREESPLGTRTTVVIETPHGELRRVDQEQRALTCSHVEEYPVKDWAVDGAAARWRLDQQELSWDPAPFVAMADKIGDNGIAICSLGHTPLKHLHWQCGLDGTCFAVVDHPAETKAYCDAYWAKLRPLYEQAAAHPRVEAAILMDNVDTPFYPPGVAETYWEPYVAEATAIMNAAGKYCFVHACGQLAGMSEIFARTKVNGLEGISHAPLGDWDASRATACHEAFVFIGGWTPLEQRMPVAEMRAFYADYLPRMPRRRVVFSTACNTEITTEWERIVLMREIVREWGGAPPG